ncbi:hypothetical protein D3C87_1354940 [compost metagenome]
MIGLDNVHNWEHLKQALNYRQALPQLITSGWKVGITVVVTKGVLIKLIPQADNSGWLILVFEILQEV